LLLISRTGSGSERLQVIKIVHASGVGCAAVKLAGRYVLAKRVRGIPIRDRQSSGSGPVDLRPWTFWAIAGLAVVVSAYLTRCWLFWEYQNDDAFITFRYSRFLATGRGPYFNVGEQVEGYTNFLLMVLLAPVFRLGGEGAVPLLAKSIGVFSGVGSLLLAWALTRRLLQGHPTLSKSAGLLGVGAAALVAASPAYAMNSTSGLETTLFGFLLMLGVTASLRAEANGRWCGAGLAFAAMVLTRPEGSFLFACSWLALAVALLLRRNLEGRVGRGLLRGPEVRRLLLDGAIVSGVFAAQLAFRIVVYDGEWLPNTYYAKSGGFWKIGAWSYIRPGIIDPFLGVAGVAFALPGAVLMVRRVPESLVLFVVAFAGAFLPLITGAGWMTGWRLSMPYLPLMACAVVLGWSVGFARLLPSAAKIVAPAVVVAALVLAAVQLPMHRLFAEEINVRANGYERGHRALAEWLRGGAADPGDRIALMDIGLIGYLCDEQAILDISGLTDRFIAKSEGSFLRKQYDPAYVLAKQPRYVVLTLTAPGWYYQPPPQDTSFGFWTRVERRLYRNAEFQSRYVRRDSDSPASDDWRERIRKRMGAIEFFEHAYPGSYYLLLVFELGPEPA
jgi:arabinofuranosyltransferase